MDLWSHELYNFMDSYNEKKQPNVLFLIFANTNANIFNIRTCECE